MGNLKPILHDDGYYIVNCEKESGAAEIVRGGNFMLGKRPVLIRKWDENFDFKRDILRVVPVWVRLLNFPTNNFGVSSH